jgi:YbbR domain-containing protein
MDWIRRNFGLRLIALLAAVVLWFTFNYQSASQTFTKTLEVPLALHGVSSGLVATTDTKEVSIELAGARTAVEDLEPEDFDAYVDCSGKRAGTFALNVAVVGPETGKPLAVTPATAVVVLDEYEYRRVPVVVDTGSSAVVTSIDPSTLMVIGGQTDVSRVFAAQVSIAAASVTKPVSVVMKAMPVDVHLSSVPGVTLAPASVRVAIAPRVVRGNI